MFDITICTGDIMRTKWQKQYDDKLDKALGMKAQTARSKLQRMLILHLCKKCNMDKCFQCGFPVETVDDMSIEHKKPWGGDSKLGSDPIPELFWDMENIAISHKWCNSCDGNSGCGKYNYIGIHDFIDNRRNYKYVRAMINVDGKQMILGHFGCPEHAALAYDIAVIRYRKGVGKLNFDKLRFRYAEYIDKNFNKDDNLFYRGGPIKEIVQHFHSMINSPTP